MRPSERTPDLLRAVTLETGVNRYAEGSCLVSLRPHQGAGHRQRRGGRAAASCAASGQGWVTAEYGMLPRATHTRGRREAAQGKQSGRTQEIQRLIGRSMRAVVDLKALGERQITLDCDVHPGRRRHAHGRDHRRLGRAAAGHPLPAGRGRDHHRPDPRPGGGGLLRRLQRTRRCSTSTTRRTPTPRPTPTSC